jgi:exodeoxyribonuclease-3
LIADDCHDGLIVPPARGWKDAFRVAKPAAVEYSWWSQRGAARANNVGWRIDYQIATPGIASTVTAAEIFPEPRFSDHAPCLVEYAG